MAGKLFQLAKIVQSIHTDSKYLVSSLNWTKPSLVRGSLIPKPSRSTIKLEVIIYLCKPQRVNHLESLRIGVERMTEYSSAWIKSILEYTLRTQFRTIDSETIIGYQDIHY